MPRKVLEDEARYRLFGLLERRPEVSQRELAVEMEGNLGKANYCLRAVVERGWVEVAHAGPGSDKPTCFYRLTPDDLCEKARTTHRSLERKLKEHDQVISEIARLRAELTAEPGSRKRTPDD